MRLIMSNDMLDLKSSCFKNLRMLIFEIDFEILCLNSQFMLFQVMINWLWIKFIFAVLTWRNIFWINNWKFFCSRAWVIMYCFFCKRNKIIEMRFLKRMIKTIVQKFTKTFRKNKFSTSDNFMKCQIKTDFYKQWEIIMRSLFSSRKKTTFLNLLIKAYTSL